MEISIKNFAAIADAKVNIGGLTVIAGENDTGKSTVGKVLFSYIKACEGYERFAEVRQRMTVLKAIEQVYFELRRNIDLAKYEDIQASFFPRSFFDAFNLDKTQAIADRLELITNLQEELIESEVAEKLKELINNVELESHEADDLLEDLVNMYLAFVRREFGDWAGDLIDDVEGRITIKDGKTTIFDDILKSDQHVTSVVEISLFKDVVLVDSGLVLSFQQMVDSIVEDMDGIKAIPKTGLQFHHADLVRKLKESVYFDDNKFKVASNSLRDLYNGELAFDKDTKSFVLNRNSKSFKLQNVASGIKVLGITDMLLKGGHFESNKLVILDEPEVNLHPKWQIEYARIICQLVKQGANIVVTTHSPYMFEALSGFSAKEDITSHFYLAEQSDEGAVLSDVSLDSSIVIERLSKPLLDLNEELYGDF